MASRRAFLRAGIGASLALAVGGGIYRVTQANRIAPPPPPFALDGEARAALTAIVPVLLAGALPAGAVAAPALDTVIGDVHRAIRGLPLATQAEIQDLFGLLALAPARRLLTGISGSWSDATPDAIHAFLQDWRTSQFGMLRAGYGALHDLVLGAWYANPASWDAIGYVGPQLEWGP
jgi:hypothetical protein